MTQLAQVIEVTGERAVVKIRRPDGCAGCSAGGCPGCAMPRAVTAAALNEAGARPGDIVELYIPNKTAGALPILTFLLPAALPIAGYFAVSAFFGDTAGYFAMAAAFLASLAAIVALDRRHLRTRGAARIIRIVENKK